MKQSLNPSVRLSSGAPQRRPFAQAFTLIELLIVIGLTAVLFALLLVPLVSAIRYTQQAQIVTAAQDAVRITRERLTRELGSAMFVFDGTSHPFVSANQPVPGDDRYTNFLDLQISDSAGNPVVGHAYAAKLDFVLPKPNQSGVEDPTTNEQIAYRQMENGSAIVSNPAFVFPLAAGTTMTRYWVGLKDPTKPYNNTREGKSNVSTDNTYILYRAQFPLYKKDVNGVLSMNMDLFAARPTKDANGNSVTVPDVDDPDFFRYVVATDIDWLDDTHTTYGQTTLPGQDVTSHNNRVEKWLQIAKPVIPGPNIDLILLPHNADNTLAFDAGTPGACTPSACPGTAHSGIAHDPVAGKYYPIINTSVTFRPATVSGDAAPGTTSEYGSQALPTTSGETGYGYVPTVYNATSRSWALPFHVSLYPGNYDGSQPYYATQISSVTDPSVTNPLYSAGDLLEFKYASESDLNPMLVYNITRGYPLQTNGNGGYKLGGIDYVPLSVSPDSGSLNFATPSFPTGPVGDSRNQRNWDYFFNATAATDPKGGIGLDGKIDLTKIDLTHTGQSATQTPPLTDPTVPPASAPNVKNAHIVPGGIRVTGPDTAAGPNAGQIIAYVERNSSAGEIGENQYTVDYFTNTIQVSQDEVNYLQANPDRKVTIVYDYQANMTLMDPTKPFDPSANTYLPMQVKLDYQTRDLIDVSIGVRLYDITSNRAQVIPSQTKIKIGNSHRG